MSNKQLKEFIFGTYVPNKYDHNRDAIVVKELIHEEGKPSKRRLHIEENYKRPFYITKEKFRDYHDKREFETIDRLDKFYSIERKLAENVFEKLNGFKPRTIPHMSQLCNSPYIYGTDISSVDLLREDYNRQYGKMFSKNTFAIMDYEWSVDDPEEPIIAGIISMQETVHIAILKEWFGSTAGAEEHIKYLCEKHVGNIIKERNITLKITFHNTSARVVIALMKTAHKLQPDFLAFWNMQADITHILSALKKDDIDPALVFSDPHIPEEYRHFHYYEDPPFKMKSNGERMSKSPSQRWHWVTAPASFTCICGMASFRLIRDREQQRTSYGVDSVMHDYINIGKMKFDEVPSEISGVDWHRVMQKSFKKEYMVYLFGDGVFVEILEEKLKDLSDAILPLSDTSSLSKIKSNPKRLITDLHIDEMDNGNIIGSTGSNMVSELDQFIPSTKDWIVTLASELEDNIGLPVIKEYPKMQTNVTFFNYDIDLTGAYPTSQVIMNASRATNVFVLCGIDGLEVSPTREIGINLTSVISNPISLAKSCFDFPDLDLIYEDFMNS
jgi:hypothetical protein